MDEFDDLDLESASEAAAARTAVVDQSADLEDEPVAKILLPSLTRKKPTTIKINLQNSTGGRSVFRAQDDSSTSAVLDIPVPVVSTPITRPSTAPPRPNLKEIDRPAELRRLYAQYYYDEDNVRSQLFKREHNRGFRIVCKICNIPCTSESNLIEHAFGKRHLSNLEEEELKRNLKQEERQMKLAPGEPVPPGFEDQVKGVPKCQEMLDNFKDSPLIGLEYLVELLPEQENDLGRLVCFLCDRKGENPLQNIRQNVISHLIGTSHRTNYLKKFFPTAHEALQKAQNDRVRRTESGRLVRTVVANIEAEYGRLQPTTTEDYCFHVRKDSIRQKIENDKHFTETPEKTFVEFVDPPPVVETLVTSFKADLQRAEEREREERLKREQDERKKSSSYRKRETSPKRNSGIFSKRSNEMTGANYRRTNKELDSDILKDDNADAAAKKARLDDPLRDTTPISLSSGSLSLSSSSRSRSRSRGRDLRIDLELRKRRSRSPTNRRFDRGYNRPPYRRNHRRSSRSRSPRGSIGSNRANRPIRSSRSPNRPNRSPNRSNRSPNRLNRSSRSPNRPTRSPNRSNRSPRLSPNRFNRSPLSNRLNQRSPSLKNRSKSPTPLNRSKSPSMARSTSVISQDRWSSKNRRSRSPELIDKRDKWSRYREEADMIEIKMEESRQYHQKNPEKHPLYNEEWKLFWNNRYKELQAEGKDGNKHDYKSEWIPFWNTKMEKIHLKEVKKKKDILRKKLELSDEDEPNEYDYKQRQYIAQIKARSNVGPNRPNSGQNRPISGSVSDMKDTWRALTGGEIQHEPPPQRMRSPTWAPPNRFQRNNSGQEPEYYKRQQERSYKISAVLRLLTALEGQLGSFGPRVNILLAEAISMEKSQVGSSEDLVRDRDNIVLFETIKEKLKGMLMAGVVDRGSVNATRLAITDLGALLDHAPPPFTEEMKNVRKTVETVPVAPTTVQRPNQTSAQPVTVPGVGSIDRTAIALQISSALLAQGKTDVTEAELQQLIDAVIGMASKPTQVEEEKVVETKTQSQNFETTPKPNALTALQSTYNEDNKSPPPPPTNQRFSRFKGDIKNLNETDLKECLRIYQHLDPEEQKAIILYLKKLEETDPEKVENLRKYVNLGKGTVVETKKRQTSPFSLRFGGNSSNPSQKIPSMAKFSIENDSDEEYSLNDIAKAATRNVEEKRKEEEKKKKDEELNKLKNLFKPASNNAIKQAIDKTATIVQTSVPIVEKTTTTMKQVIEATTDSMIAGLKGFAASRKESPHKDSLLHKESPRKDSPAVNISTIETTSNIPGLGMTNDSLMSGLITNQTYTNYQPTPNYTIAPPTIPPPHMQQYGNYYPQQQQSYLQQYPPQQQQYAQPPGQYQNQQQQFQQYTNQPYPQQYNYMQQGNNQPPQW